MKVLKEAYFDRFMGSGWPNPSELRPYFFDPSLRDWRAATTNDSWGLNATKVDPRELAGCDEISELWLTLVGNPFHGVFFNYQRVGARGGKAYYSKGDLRRLREWVETKDGDLLPVGLFIPFDVAWRAVKEYIERDGALPSCIEWLASGVLPPNTFPRWGFEGDERVWTTKG
jgi:hypothetical protein